MQKPTLGVDGDKRTRDGVEDDRETRSDELFEPSQTVNNNGIGMCLELVIVEESVGVFKNRLMRSEVLYELDDTTIIKISNIISRWNNGQRKHFERLT